jgi:hypothetical protein
MLITLHAEHLVRQSRRQAIKDASRGAGLGLVVVAGLIVYGRLLLEMT